MSKNLFIVKRITEDKNLSDMAFTVWCGLRCIMMKDIKEYFVSFNSISYSLFKRVPERKELDAIKKGFSELVDVGYVKVIEEYSKNEFVLDLSALYFEYGDGYYSGLTQEEMVKILNLNCKQDKYKLLRYFTCQIGTFNLSLDVPYKGKIGGMSLDNFVEMLGYSKSTIVAYNRLLMKEKILYFHVHGDFYQTTSFNGQSQLREMPNTYARYSDRNLALEYMRQFQGWKFWKADNITRSADANYKRALAQKLRAFKNGKEYDIETIKELYEYADTKNLFAKAEYDKAIKGGYYPNEPDLIDMSIFDDYWIEIGEA